MRFLISKSISLIFDLKRESKALSVSALITADGCSCLPAQFVAVIDVSFNSMTVCLILFVWVNFVIGLFICCLSKEKKS